MGSLFSSVLLGYGSPARNVWVVFLAARWRVEQLLLSMWEFPKTGDPNIVP